MTSSSKLISSLKISDLDFTFLEMNPFTLVDGKPYPLDMRGKLDDTASSNNFQKYVGDLVFASELGNYAEYSGVPNEEEVLQYAKVVIDVWTLALLSHYNVARVKPLSCT
ncbi:hypothetical protein DITRI_Ditri05aG0089100 [Diplodiscus trichospermus]